MFQYTREIIINDQVFSTGTDAKTSDKILHIDMIGNYRSSTIKNAKIVKGVAAVPTELALPTTTTTADVTRYTVKIGLQTGEVDAILANYTTIFSRGIKVEVAKGANAAAILTAFKVAMQDLQEWPVKLNVANSKIVAKSPYVTLQLITEDLTYRANSISEMIVTATASGSVAKGVRGFGTYEKLISNHRLPTLDNIRYGGLNQEELPQPGHLYSLVEFQVVADRNIGGFDVLGQKATSVTTHRFWVRDDKAQAFIDACETVVNLDLDGDSTIG